MQYDLHERDVQFFTNMFAQRVRNLDPIDILYSEKLMYRVKFRWTERLPRTIKITDSSDYLLFRMTACIKENGLSKKVMLCITNRKIAEMFGLFLQEVSIGGKLHDSMSEQLRLPMHRNRIKVVTANGTSNSWQRNFLNAPNEHAADFDVLIATPTFQAGQSLDGNISRCMVGSVLY